MDKISGRLHHYISGDTIHLSEADFPSLKRPANAGYTGVGSVTVDARLIIYDMPLVFDSTTVVLVAEQVIWTHLGELHLGATPQVGGDGITIITSRLDLSKVKQHPFVFYTDNWTPAWPDNAFPMNAKRKVEVYANIVIGQSDPPDRLSASYDEELLKFFRVLTLDHTVSRYPGSKLPYHLEIGSPAAMKRYNDSLLAALWPTAFAAKVARQFSQSPYDGQSNRFIEELVSRYSEVLLGINYNVVLRLTSIRQAILHNEDLYGRNTYYVPRVSFSALLKRFKDSLNSAKDLTSEWDAAIVASHIGKVLTEEDVKGALNQIDSAKDAINFARQELNTALVKMEVLQQQVAAKLQQIDNAREAANQRLRELVQKDESNRRLGYSIKIVVTAASLIPAAAPVGLAVGPALNVAGDLVYQHNTGASFQPLSLIQLIQNAQAFVSKVRELREKGKVLYETLGDLSKPSAIGEAATNFGSKANEIYQSLEIPKPTQLDINAVEKDDALLQGYLLELAALRDTESSLLKTFQDLNRVFGEKVLASSSAERQLTALLASNIQNDRAIAERKMLAIQMRDVLFNDLAYDAAELGRACVYHVETPAQTISQTAPTQPLLVGRPDRMLMSDIEHNLDGTLMAKWLAEERADIWSSYAAFVSFMDKQNARFVERTNGARITQKFFSASSLNSRSSNQVEFIKMLNLELANQVRFRAKPESPVYIPMDEYSSMVQGSTKLLDVDVSKVIFASPSAMKGKALQFRVLHPGYGMLSISGGCYFVDHRRPDAPVPGEFFPTTWSEDGMRSKDAINMRYPDLAKDVLQHSRFPFASKFFLYVTVEGDPSSNNWKDTPVISEIQLTFYVF